MLLCLGLREFRCQLQLQLLLAIALPAPAVTLAKGLRAVPPWTDGRPSHRELSGLPGRAETVAARTIGRTETGR